jgi:Domain of unknown function (DUF4388)
MTDPRSSSFTGQLSQFQLVELVQAVGMNGSTGALYLDREAEKTSDIQSHHRGIIYFVNGALTACREYESQALTLGAVLQQLKYADAHMIEDNYDRQIQDPLGEPLGQRLVSSGTLTPDQLSESLRTQMLWTVREMALWKTGTYYFNNGEMPPPRTMPCTIEASRVVLEIVRYQYEWKELQQWLPDGMHTYLEMSAEPPIEHALVFTSQVWRTITHVNAFHTPRQIATALCETELETARILALLVRDTLLRAAVSPHSFNLPEVARTMATEQVNILGLLSRMEQEWPKRRSLLEQLLTLGIFINWTMDELELAWQQNNRSLDPGSLRNLLRREQCDHIGEYEMPLNGNHIELSALQEILRAQAGSARRPSMTPELQDAYFILRGALRAVFNAINMRVDSLLERNLHESAWQGLLDEIDEKLNR